jgi:hypothetical protein
MDDPVKVLNEKAMILISWARGRRLTFTMENIRALCDSREKRVLRRLGSSWWRYLPREVRVNGYVWRFRRVNKRSKARVVYDRDTLAERVLARRQL